MRWASYESNRRYAVYFRNPKTRKFERIEGMEIGGRQSGSLKLRYGIPQISYRGQPYKFPFKKVEE
tara:strand:+ start:353 stop:550 length:198 start_codon:yes stop_codon:yes gene_type:complete